MATITLLDGAFGTELWRMAEAAGIEKRPVWRYNIEAPQLVESLSAEYVKAGTEMLYANTFVANKTVCGPNGFDAGEVIKAGVTCARRGAEIAGRPETKIALSVGPLFNALEPFGDTTEEQCADIYEDVCRNGLEAGADLIVLETFMDIDMLSIAAEKAVKTGLPVFCSMSFASEGNRTLYGVGTDDMLEALEPLGISAIGLNCSFGPDKAIPVIREFAEKTGLPLLLKPNSGDLSPEDFVKAIAPALPLVSYVGGCCGTSPEYIRQLRAALQR